MRLPKTSILILVIGIIVVITLYKNPPIISSGISSNIDNRTKIVEIINKGIAGVIITNVSINDTVKPKKVEVGKNNQLVLGVPEYLKSETSTVFENALGFKIKPNYNNKSLHYGIVIYNDTPINKVVINYRYFGLPFRFSKSLDLSP